MRRTRWIIRFFDHLGSALAVKPEYRNWPTVKYGLLGCGVLLSSIFILIAQADHSLFYEILFTCTGIACIVLPRWKRLVIIQSIAGIGGLALLGGIVQLIVGHFLVGLEILGFFALPAFILIQIIIRTAPSGRLNPANVNWPPDYSPSNQKNE